MQPQTRLGDDSFVPADGHGKICCTHTCKGPAETGSEDVFVNNKKAVRVTDTGVHSTCCGPNTWIAVEGSETVLINNLQAHRLFDMDVHCGGPGWMIQASPDVFVGDGTESAMSDAKKTGKALVEICGGR
ncbi:MAG: PAAR domain-containing protein [Acidobacteriia bacterium]|nr:PAAR domain-containing protein [Terriglobia bacterium]